MFRNFVDIAGENVGQERTQCDFGLESLDKHEPRDILHCHVAERAE
jgi:hypothetical protein